MSALKDVLDRLPFDASALRKLPVPGLSGDCLLELDLARGVGETAPSSPIEAFRERHRPTLHALVTGLREAAEDPKVLGLVVHACAPMLAPVHAEELRAAVEAFADSDKPVVAWAETFGEMTGGMAGYLVATAADEIWLQPSGYLQLTGAAAEVSFLREGLDKIGVEPQFDRRHEYKSAMETYTETHATEPMREVLQSLTDSAVASMLAGMARGRGMEPADLQGVIDEGVFDPARALELRLIDRVGYRDQAYASLREEVGVEEPELRFVERYDGSTALKALRQRGRPVVAVVQAHGAIHIGRSGSSPLAGRSIGSDSLTAALRHVENDDKVEAVVLRVDSPGGSAVASDTIWRAIHRLRTRKPVVASMGNVAGSGGYFISMPCTEIFAGATTLTGSIGVLAGKLVTQEGFGKLGINREMFRRGRYAGMFSGQQGFTEDEFELLSRILDDIYAQFTRKAAEDRQMPLDVLEPLARGRVWSGAQAAENGLVDRVGGLHDAVRRAADLADLDPDDVETRISPKLGPFDRFMPADNSDSPAAALGATSLLAPVGDGGPLVDRLLGTLGLQHAGVLSMPTLRWV
ncbi:MAG: signal peptide peptidase SppA [Mobilicoccus sp.]|nr:signal peptide peptidase SppA [Mobilicoccus sp.]